MKLNRLMGILTCLLQRERVTAQQLADRFEVSRRTILRDVETLNLAGIPIQTLQGGNGGIALMEGYTLSKSLLDQEELRRILIGLKSLESISAQGQSQTLMEKLSLPQARDNFSEYIRIDLSSYYRESLTEKIQLLGSAIQEHHPIQFTYYYEKGENKRCAEPYFIQYKWADWYLFAWCCERQDFRLFKLNRLWDLSLTNRTFLPRTLPYDAAERDPNRVEPYSVTLLFDKSVRFRLIETYGPHCFREQENGLFMELSYANHAHIRQWILSFGKTCTVLKPEAFRREIQQEAAHMLLLYENRID